MKKYFVPFATGVAATLLVTYISNIVSDRGTAESFGQWPGLEHEDVKSAFKTRDWTLVELENNDKANQNLTSSRYGKRRVFMKPRDPDLGYILCIEEGDGEPKMVWIADNKGKQLSVSLQESRLKNAQIHGKGFLAMDSDLDGIIDSRMEFPKSKTEKTN